MKFFTKDVVPTHDSLCNNCSAMNKRRALDNNILLKPTLETTFCDILRVYKYRMMF